MVRSLTSAACVRGMPILSEVLPWGDHVNRQRSWSALVRSITTLLAGVRVRSSLPQRILSALRPAIFFCLSTMALDFSLPGWSW